MVSFWGGRRVVVTGGAGFLGPAIGRKLQEAGAAEIFVPRTGDYDLRKLPGFDRALADGRPGLVIHLGVVVGGIGAASQSPSGPR